MRGDKQFIAASIVDKAGDIVYHVIPAIWVRVSLGVLGLLIVIAICLGLLILNNKADIDNLKNKITVEGQGNAKPNPDR